MEVKMERRLFESIWFLALQRKIDMSETLKFCLTPFQRCVAKIDGSIQQTHKKVYCLKSKKHELYLNPLPILVLLELMA